MSEKQVQAPGNLRKNEKGSKKVCELVIYKPGGEVQIRIKLESNCEMDK